MEEPEVRSATLASEGTGADTSNAGTFITALEDGKDLTDNSGAIDSEAAGEDAIAAEPVPVASSSNGGSEHPAPYDDEVPSPQTQSAAQSADLDSSPDEAGSEDPSVEATPHEDDGAPDQTFGQGGGEGAGGEHSSAGQDPVPMAQTPLTSQTHLRSVRSVNEVRQEQWGRSSVASAKKGSAAPCRGQFLRMYGAGTQSAPTTPSGNRSNTATTRNRLHNVITEETYADVWILARALLSEREEEERLEEALSTKQEEAECRRVAMSPKPTKHQSTPFSLVSTETGMQPAGWKSSWKATSHIELSQSARQVENEINSNRKKGGERFVKELLDREAEVAHKEAKKADFLASTLASYKAQSASSQQLIAAVKANVQAKCREHDAKSEAKQARSHQYQQEYAEAMQQHLQRNAQMRDEQHAMAKNSREQHEGQRKQLKEELHGEREQRRAKSASKRDALYRNHLARKDQEKQHEDAVWTRAMGNRERFQSYLDKKNEKIKKDVARASMSREAHYRDQAQMVAIYNADMLASAREKQKQVAAQNSMVYDKILDKHSALFDNVLKREKEAAERDLYLQQKYCANNYYAHWAKELRAEAAIKNRLPDIRSDVREKLEKIQAIRSGGI